MNIKYKFISITVALLSIAASLNAQKAQPVCELPEQSEVATLIQQARYSTALSLIDKEIKQAKRKRKPVDHLEAQREEAEKGLMYLKGTDNVLIVDSIVTDKKSFLKAYNLCHELGTLLQESNGATTRFTTQRGNKVFRSEKNKEGKLELVSYYQEQAALSNRQVLQGLSVDGDMNYPFLMSDGMTFYFAARSEEGLGNYDIYATRYDADADRFYKAENMGFPYNSYANDYMMVVDEENEIGWFASDRYQPEGKVCIYTFIPNTSRHALDYESAEESQIIAAATLRSVKSTWTEANAKARRQAKERISKLSAESDATVVKEIEFVVNDQHTYTLYSQFRSSEARELCRRWMGKKTELNDTEKLLDSLRERFAKGNKDVRGQILELEASVLTLCDEIHNLEKEIRRIELNK